MLPIEESIFGDVMGSRMILFSDLTCILTDIIIGSKDGTVKLTEAQKRIVLKFASRRYTIFDEGMGLDLSMLFNDPVWVDYVSTLRNEFRKYDLVSGFNTEGNFSEVKSLTNLILGMNSCCGNKTYGLYNEIRKIRVEFSIYEQCYQNQYDYPNLYQSIYNIIPVYRIIQTTESQIFELCVGNKRVLYMDEILAPGIQAEPQDSNSISVLIAAIGLGITCYFGYSNFIAGIFSSIREKKTQEQQKQILLLEDKMNLAWDSMRNYNQTFRTIYIKYWNESEPLSGSESIFHLMKTVRTEE